MTSPDSQLLLRESKKIVDALGEMLAPLVEIVLHDLTRPEHSIIAIANNLSGRQVGDPTTEIGMARIGDNSFPEVLQNYPNKFPDGRPAKSTSIGIKDSQGNYIAALCLNMDVSMLTAAAANVLQLVQTQSSPIEIKESLASRHVKEVRSSLEQFAVARNTTPRALTREQRQQALSDLAEKGLLNLKNALSEVATVLGVARSTVYTYLPETRKSL
jgi:predicted transcriptional regulator YheO